MGTTKNITLYPGDTLQSTCVFDTTSRDSITPIGLATFDEMCYVQFGMNIVPGEEFKFRCESDQGSDDIWLGELAEGDDGRNAASLYPLSEATMRWAYGIQGTGEMRMTEKMRAVLAGRIITYADT